MCCVGLISPCAWCSLMAAYAVDEEDRLLWARERVKVDAEELAALDMV